MKPPEKYNEEMNRVFSTRRLYPRMEYARNDAEISANCNA